MEIVAVTILCLVVLSFVLKLTFHSLWGILIMSILTGLFILVVYKYAIEQSKLQIKEWLAQPRLLLDITILLTVDVAFQIAFCFLYIRDNRSFRKRALKELCLWFPGLLIFPALFTGVTQLVFALPGKDFDLTGRCFAIGCVVIFPCLGYLLRRILPERELRCELLFYIALLITMLGITATVNGKAVVIGNNVVEWGALSVLMAIIVAVALTGLIIERKIIKTKISKYR